ncbi:MAG TPA: TonB-dependent receptor, partial [Bacteroidota bacterium]
MRSKAIPLMVCVTALFWSQTSFSGTTGKIAGVVKDASTGEPIPGVNVFLEGTTTGAAADIDGKYFIINVPPGTYTVLASVIGYTSVRQTNVAVSVDLTTALDFSLSPTVLELGTEVVITAERPLVKKDLTSVESRVTAAQIQSMPVQDFGDVLNLQSGVTVDRFGNIHIRGGRTSEIAYWVDGVSVTDVYDNSASVIIENNFVQELQVISGTFNAEYGNAMSGIINVVTKEGGRRYEGNFSTYAGDYSSSDDQLFYNIENFRPTANRNFQASLGGPVPGFGDTFTFYATARYFHTDGWLYGQRRFTTSGYFGDNAAVSLNWRTKWSGQAKLTYRFSPTFKLSINGLGSTEDYHDYNHDYRYNPDGDVNKFNDGYNLNLSLTHTLSARTFYDVDVSRSYKVFNEYLYEDPLDQRYMHPDFLNRGAYN